MKDRKLEAKVLRFVREIGIPPDSKVRTVGFDLTRGVVVISTRVATSAAPAAGLWSDYADNVARIRPRHAPLSSARKDEPSQVPTPHEPRPEQGRLGRLARESSAPLLLAFRVRGRADRVVRLQAGAEATGDGCGRRDEPGEHEQVAVAA
jgi:hypothetical protein